ncbi:MAG TPA: hypothetical protein VGL99_30635 [Chloroflexota bacterium]
MPTVGLYVSGHGFGHAVRSAEVASALLELGTRVVIRTDAPGWLFPPTAEYLAGPAVDVGVVQHDGLEFDVDATRQRWHEFGATFEQRAADEAQLLRQQRADFVLGDMPPLAFAAAARAGLPSAAISNFGWDWIYVAWPDMADAIRCVQLGYAQADVLYRLPLHSPCADAFPAFQTIEDIPLIARRARRPRTDVRRDLGLPDQAVVVLISFGAFQADRLDLGALAALENYRFVITPPIANGPQHVPANVLRIDQQPKDYVSLLAACDVVVTKPGYGIVADCLANRVAVLYTDRGPFREYDVLADALQRLGWARYVRQADVLSGNLGPHLEALLNGTNTWAELPLDGAQVVARRALERLTISRNAVT